MLEPIPPIPGGEISAVNPQVVTERLKQVAQTGLDPDNRKRIIRSLPGHVQQKYENNRSYSLLDAVVESTLKGKKQIPHEERKKFADGLRESLEAAGIDITNPNIPLDSLTRAYLETGQSIDFSSPVEKAKGAVTTQITNLSDKAIDTRQILEKLQKGKQKTQPSSELSAESGNALKSADTQEKARQTLQEVKDRALALGSYGKALLEGSKDRRTIDEEIGKLPLEEQVKIQQELIDRLVKEAALTTPSVQEAEKSAEPAPAKTRQKPLNASPRPNVFDELIQEVKAMPSSLVTPDEIENGPAFLRRAEQPPSTTSTPLQEPVAPVEPASLAVEQRSQGDIDSLELENLEYEPVDVSAASAETTVNDALREPRGYPEEGLETAAAEPAVQAQEEMTKRLAEMEERKQKLNPEQDSIKKDVETIAGLALANYEDRLQKLVGLADKKGDAITLESFDAFAAEITTALENSRAWNKEMHDANLDAVKNALLTEIVRKAPKKTLPDWLDKKDLPDWLFLEEPPPPTPRKLPDWIDLKEPRYVSEDETVQITNNSHEEFSTVQGKVNLRDQSYAAIQSLFGRLWWDESTSITAEDTSMADIQNNKGLLVLTDSAHGFIDNNEGKVNLSGSSSVHVDNNQDWLNYIHISERGSVYIGSNSYSLNIVDDGMLFIPPEISLHRINQEAINNTFSLTVPALENDLAATSDNHRILEISGRTFAVIKAQGIGENEQQKAIAVFEKRMVATESGQEEKYIFLDGRKAEDKTTLIDRLKAKTRLEDVSEFESSIASLETQTSSPQPEQNTTSALKPWQMKAEAYAAPNNTTSFEDAKQKLTEHRNLVREALINREDVPLEVLETYPDLANEFGIKLPVSEQIRPQSVGSTVGNPHEEASSYWGDHANAYKGVVRPLRTLAEEELDRLAIEASQVPKKNKNILARIFRR